MVIDKLYHDGSDEHIACIFLIVCWQLELEFVIRINQQSLTYMSAGNRDWRFGHGNEGIYLTLVEYVSGFVMYAGNHDLHLYLCALATLIQRGWHYISIQKQEGIFEGMYCDDTGVCVLTHKLCFLCA